MRSSEVREKAGNPAETERISECSHLALSAASCSKVRLAFGDSLQKNTTITLAHSHVIATRTSPRLTRAASSHQRVTHISANATTNTNIRDRYGRDEVFVWSENLSINLTLWRSREKLKLIKLKRLHGNLMEVVLPLFDMGMALIIFGVLIPMVGMQSNIQILVTEHKFRGLIGFLTKTSWSWHCFEITNKKSGVLN